MDMKKYIFSALFQSLQAKQMQWAGKPEILNLKN